MKKPFLLLFIFALFGIFFVSSNVRADYLSVSWEALETNPNFTVWNSANSSVDHSSWRRYPQNQGDAYDINAGPFPGSDYGTLYSWNPNNITQFDIYLKGKNYVADGDNIDVFVSFQADKPTSSSTIYRLTSTPPSSNIYTLPTGYFDVTYDLVNQTYNYGSGDIDIIYSDPSFDPLSLFQNQDDFWIGYGCHFEHYKTRITVQGAGYHDNVIPEPATMFLFGSGLIGLAGIGRKRYFKKS